MSSITPQPIERARRILVVSDQPVYRAGLSAIIDETQRYAGSSTSSEPAELAAAIDDDALCAILVVADGRACALSLVARILNQLPSFPMILVVTAEHPDLVSEGLRLGVRAFLDATSSACEVEAALSAVESGGVFLSRQSADLLQDRTRTADRPPGASSLSPRQREVLALVAQGMSTAEIAANLDVSPRTIDSHRLAISKRLGIRNVADLIRYAIRERLAST